MKKSLKLGLSLLPLVTSGITSLSSCVTIHQYSEDYKTRDIAIYEEVNQGKAVASSFISLRFFESRPNVPYIGVRQFFKKFYTTDIYMERLGFDGNVYVYRHEKNNPEFISFVTGPQNTFMTNGLDSFDQYPDAIPDASKTFICDTEEEDTINTPSSIKSIQLDNYSIKIFNDFNDVYVPLQFLNDMFGCTSGYNIAYNGQDIYIFDQFGNIQGNERDLDYYGDKYYEVLGNMQTQRPKDLAEYVYNQLCFTFDNLRGYTSQLLFGDNNLVSLGLNGLLEWKYPKIKEYLLSQDKSKYLQGMVALFAGLDDGGHTVVNYPDVNIYALKDYANRFSVFTAMRNATIDEDFKPLIDEQQFFNYIYFCLLDSVVAQRNDTFGLPEDAADKNGFYYKTFPDKKIAYIGFDHFRIDFPKWDEFYNSGSKVEKEKLLNKLITNDSFAFVRDKFIQAKAEGMDKVVLDLASNGGGTLGSLIGIVGLLNHGKCNIDVNDVLNKSHSSSDISIDLNLDGVFDKNDELWAHENIDGLKIGILTTQCSFSCGNLLPCILKEYGYKIIGMRSGGGCCSVMYSTTADGLCYCHSSYSCLTDQAGNNIDAGVEPDKELEVSYNYDEQRFDCADLFDFTKISEYLDSAYTENN